MFSFNANDLFKELEVFELLEAGISITEIPSLKSLYRNKYYNNLLGLNQFATTLGSDGLVTRVHNDDKELIINSVDYLLKNPNDEYRIVYRIWNQNNEIVWLYSSFKLIEDKDVKNSSSHKMLGTTMKMPGKLLNQKQIYTYCQDQSRVTNASKLAELSAREKEVFLSIVRRDRLIDSALELGVTLNTLKTHKRNIMNKLGIKSMAELMVFAVKNGLE